MSIYNPLAQQQIDEAYERSMAQMQNSIETAYYQQQMANQMAHYRAQYQAQQDYYNQQFNREWVYPKLAGPTAHDAAKYPAIYEAWEELRAVCALCGITIEKIKGIER